MKKMRGVVTFVFDDGYERVYNNVLPVLNQHNMPGVFALAINGQKLEKTEERKVRPWHQWLDVREHGHEIASHSVNHPNLKKRTKEEIEREMRESKAKLGARTFVYPGGGYNKDVKDVSSMYYDAARTVVYGFESIPPKDPYELRSYNFSRKNFSVWRANLLAMWAWLTDSWLIETYHMVDDTDQAMLHSVTTRDFARHVSFVARLPIHVRTIADVMENVS